MDEHIYPNEAQFYEESERLGPWAVQPIVERLKEIGRTSGLWNLFLPDLEDGPGLAQQLVDPRFDPQMEIAEVAADGVKVISRAAGADQHAPCHVPVAPLTRMGLPARSIPAVEERDKLRRRFDRSFAGRRLLRSQFLNLDFAELGDRLRVQRVRERDSNHPQESPPPAPL